jgi:uncharacterized membrane protein YbhN (UPF0104 family)
MTRKTLITLLQGIIFLGLGGAVVWYMFSQMTDEQQQQMFASVRSTRLWMLIPVFVVTLIAHWARAKRWQLMLDPLGIHPTTANTTFAVLIGYLINLVPPRAGEVAKCTVLARYEKVPADKMVGTIVAERVWDIICLVVVIGLGLLLQQDELGQYLRAELEGRAPKPERVFLILGVLAAIVGTLILVYRRYRESRIGRFIKGLAEGIGSILRVKKRGMFMLYTSFIWIGYLLQIQLGFWSIPATQHLGMGASLMTLIFGSFAMIAAPGGIGLYPFIVGRMLSKGYPVTPAAAAAFGWVSWVSLTAIVIILGMASLLLLPFYNRKPHDAQAPVDPEQDS